MLASEKKASGQPKPTLRHMYPLLDLLPTGCIVGTNSTWVALLTDVPALKITRCSTWFRCPPHILGVPHQRVNMSAPII